MNALIELKRTQAGSPARRWYYSSSIDLITWHDENDSLTGFELYYDKQARQHVLVWDAERGYGHFAVDDGEQKPVGEHKQTPMLVPDGRVDPERIMRLFEGVAGELPSALSALVRERLAYCPWARG